MTTYLQEAWSYLIKTALEPMSPAEAHLLHAAQKTLLHLESQAGLRVTETAASGLTGLTSPTTTAGRSAAAASGIRPQDQTSRELTPSSSAEPTAAEILSSRLRHGDPTEAELFRVVLYFASRGQEEASRLWSATLVRAVDGTTSTSVSPAWQPSAAATETPAPSGSPASSEEGQPVEEPEQPEQVTCKCPHIYRIDARRKGLKWDVAGGHHRDYCPLYKEPAPPADETPEPVAEADTRPVIDVPVETFEASETPPSPETCPHRHIDKDGKCWDCGTTFDPRGILVVRVHQAHGVYTPIALLALLEAEKELPPAAVTEAVPAESYEPEVTPIPAPGPECNCPEEWWRARPRFNARERNEAHEPACPLYRQGAHFFPLPDPRDTDGSGVYTATCVWCGETKEMRPYEQGLGPFASSAKHREEAGISLTPTTRAPGPRAAVPKVRTASGYVSRTERTPEELDAMKAKKCIDCGATISGFSPRCMPCGRAKRAAATAGAAS